MAASYQNRVENIVGKEEIARYEQFLLFPQCFQKACFLGASKGVIVWEWVNTSTSASTETSILYTDGHMDRHTATQTQGQGDPEYTGAAQTHFNINS